MTRKTLVAILLPLVLTVLIGCATLDGLSYTQPRSQEPVAREGDRKVYDADECIGPVINGRCHGTILPKKAYHPTCYGEWVGGRCTGPQF